MEAGYRMPGTRLTRDERGRIEALLGAGHTIPQVAGLLGRDRTTIWRAVTAGGGKDAYRARAAQQGADERARRPRTSVLAAASELEEKVLRRVKVWRWSPHAVAAQLRAEGGATVCAETIYQACYQGIGRFEGGWAWLASMRRRRRPRRRGEAARRNVLGEVVNVAERPAAAACRSEAGHWEGDLIKGAGNRSGLATLVERVSRFTLVGRLPGGCTAAEALACLTGLFARVPKHLRRSLTWDQGREMAEWAQLQEGLGLPVYFCDPHSPWQRPSNEQANGLLRRYFPKGTDLSAHSQIAVDLAAFKLNAMPRKIHNWTSAQYQYNLLTGCNNR